MRTQTILTTLAFLILPVLSIHAEISVPSDGSDGVLHVTADDMTTRQVGQTDWGDPINDTAYWIDLALAPAGQWDDASSNSGTNTGRGIYDPEKWAVVFKYQSVHIEEGAKVRFDNHPSNPPVVWLVAGDVQIDGHLCLDGYSGLYGGMSMSGIPGPGGFRAGMQVQPGAPRSCGFGPGGAHADGGIYASQRYCYDHESVCVRSYGNESIMPLVGGSGASGHTDVDWGGGGGAILIVTHLTLSLNGTLSADGGMRGSGGAIRLIAGQLDGNGMLSAVNDLNGVGRIALEAVSCDLSGITSTPQPFQTSVSNPLQIWPSVAHPEVQVLYVGGTSVPEDAKSELTGYDADIVIQNDSSADLSVLVEARNVPLEATVTVMLVPTSPEVEAQRIHVQADFVGGNEALSSWEASIPGNEQLSTLQVRADWGDEDE